MEDEVSGPVILISKFNVEPKDLDHFLKIWEENATNFKRQPDLFRHNYIKALQKVVFLSVTPFGNRRNMLKMQQTRS